MTPIEQDFEKVQINHLGVCPSYKGHADHDFNIGLCIGVLLAAVFGVLICCGIQSNATNQMLAHGAGQWSPNGTWTWLR
jgi:hypothetical protein